MTDIFQRTRLLVGDDVMERIAETKVIIFGLGGVGSWCAEGLVRSGIRHLTIVDMDTVSESNINRQLIATSKTVGKAKVEVMRDRLLEINPETEIKNIQEQYTPENSESFNLASYDYIIDCIDSLKDKAALILEASASGAKVISSMGSALKLDPTKVRVAEFWNVRGCPLASAIRKRYRQAGLAPKGKVTCIYDDEVLPNRGGWIDPMSEYSGTGPKKAQVNGTIAPITAIFGFTAASLVIQDIYTGSTSTVM